MENQVFQESEIQIIFWKENKMKETAKKIGTVATATATGAVIAGYPGAAIGAVIGVGMVVGDKVKSLTNHTEGNNKQNQNR